MMSCKMKIYKPEEVAQILGLGRNTIYELLRCGQLRSVKVGRRYLVTQDAINNFLDVFKNNSNTEN